MTDCHLIVFLDNQNLGLDTKIGFLSGTVPKLLDIYEIMLTISGFIVLYQLENSKFWRELAAILELC